MTQGRKMKIASLVHLILLISVGAAIYAGVLMAPFNFDDGPYLVNNPAIRDYSFFLDRSRLGELTVDHDVKSNFVLRPVTYLTFALNYSIHDLDVRGYHLVNLLLHIANALLVYRLLGLTLKTPHLQQRLGTGSTLVDRLPLFAALLFIAHPLQTQAVTYIIQRCVPLATFFCLSALVLYIQGRLDQGRPRDRLLLVLSFAATLLAMKSKEISFTLPLVMLLYEFMFFQGELKSRLLRLLPFLASMVLIPWTTIQLAASGHGPGSAPLHDPTDLVNFSDISRWKYLLTQSAVIIQYLRLLLVPLGQSLDHDYPLVDGVFNPPVLGSLPVLLALGGMAVWLWRRSVVSPQASPWSRPAAFGILWFFITLAVESSVIPLEDPMVEHRLYLPSIGFFMALLAGGTHFAGRMSFRWASMALAIVVLLLGTLTVKRNQLWRDNVTIWSDAVSKSPGLARTHNNLGFWLNQAGRYSEAVMVLQNGVERFPEYPKLYINLGIALSSLGRLDEALTVTREAFRRDPGNAKLANNLATFYLKKGMPVQGQELLRKALELNPTYALAYYNLAQLLEQQGKPDEAREALGSAAIFVGNDSELLRDITELAGRLNFRKVATGTASS